MSNNIQMKEAAELAKKWNGGPCDHENLSKEYELGTATGDYVCDRCGECGWGKDWPKKERKDKKND